MAGMKEYNGKFARYVPNIVFKLPEDKIARYNELADSLRELDEKMTAYGENIKRERNYTSPHALEKHLAMDEAYQAMKRDFDAMDAEYNEIKGLSDWTFPVKENKDNR